MRTFLHQEVTKTEQPSLNASLRRIGTSITAQMMGENTPLPPFSPHPKIATTHTSLAGQEEQAPSIPAVLSGKWVEATAGLEPASSCPVQLLACD